MDALTFVSRLKVPPAAGAHCQRCLARVCGRQFSQRIALPAVQPQIKQWSQRTLATTNISTSKNENEVAVALKGSRLTSRSLVQVRGKDAGDLLQGLMTNDIDLLGGQDGQAVIYSMFLNKLGRVLYDVMCYQWVKGQDDSPSFVLECDAAVSLELQKHLKLYRIRKKVDITSLDSEYHVWSVYGSNAASTPPPSPDSRQLHRHADPRVRGLGQRVILPHGQSVPDAEESVEADYITHRYRWGVAEGVNELPPGECLPLEANLALMNGVSFTKGCYLGQELTARTHHTGVIRKRFTPVTLLGEEIPTLLPGSSIKTAEGKNVGKLRCHLQENGIALLRTALIGNKLWISSDGETDVELAARRAEWWPEETPK